jgi:hypothetical protein
MNLFKEENGRRSYNYLAKLNSINPMIIRKPEAKDENI